MAYPTHVLMSVFGKMKRTTLLLVQALSASRSGSRLSRLPILPTFDRSFVEIGDLKVDPPLPGNAIDVKGIGRLTVAAGQEPADAIASFAARATHNGHTFTYSNMTAAYDTICSRVLCKSQLLGPLVINVSFGECVCQAFQDPVDAVLECVRGAIKHGLGMTRYQVEEMVSKFCSLKVCVVELPPALTFHVSPLGYVTVEAWEEPAEIVEKLARTLHASGTPVARDFALRVVDWFCERRSCKRHVAPDLSLTLALSSDASIVANCLYWEPPEFAIQNVLSSLPFSSSAARNSTVVDLLVAQAMTYFCQSKPCGWGLEKVLRLKVWSFQNESVGTLTCDVLQDPADCVESFVRKSLSFGFDLESEDLKGAMGMMMSWLCRRRYCSRSVAPEVELLSNGSRYVVARSWEEPWKVASSFAKESAQRGIVLNEEDVLAIYLEICRHRYFCSSLPRIVGVHFEGVGNVTCRSWEQPADVVESFAYRAVNVGHTLRAKDLHYILDLMCSQRQCTRHKLSVVATSLIMHPGKTAGRALGTALRQVHNIFVLGHDIRCGDDSRRCLIVLRNPIDRFVSALAFKKQGGEWGSELLLGNTCHRWLVDKHLDDIIDDVDGLNAYCEFADAASELSTHCIFRSVQLVVAAFWWSQEFRSQATALVGRRK